ncbi:MAG: hypothetical protein JWN53_1646, partial [Gemmatimonadetes bacterium]|nr:hypothetical protein [Gemmatimonadota bacterium]
GVHQVDETSIVVTRFLQPFTSLPAWLAAHSTASPLGEATQIIAAVAPTPSAPAAGSFTAMFGSAKGAAAEVPPPAAEAKKEPGEFTRMFQGVKIPPPVPAPVANSAPPPSFAPTLVPGGSSAPPAAKAADAPREGSFTSLFGTVAPSAHATTPATVPPTAPGPPPIAPRTLAPSAARFDAVMPPVDYSVVAPPPTPSKAPEAPAGAFTELFRRLETPGSVPVVPSSPPFPPAPLAPAPSYATAAPQPPTPSWQTPAAPIAPVAPTPMAPPAPMLQPQGRAVAGPSEFTRILGKVAVPPADQRAPASPMAAPPSAPQFGMPPMPQIPQVQMPQMQMPPASAGGFATPQFHAPPVPTAPLLGAPTGSAPPAKSNLPIIIALNVILVIAVGIVLYVVLKR